MQLLRDFYAALWAEPVDKGTLLLLVAALGVIGTLTVLWYWNRPSARSWLENRGAWAAILTIATILLTFECIFIAYYMYDRATPVSISYWAWVLALLPAAIVAQQGLYLVLVKSAAVKSALSENVASTGPTNVKKAQFLDPGREKADRQRRHYFDPLQLSLQYGLLTLFLAIVGVTLAHVVCDPPECLVMVGENVAHNDKKHGPDLAAHGNTAAPTADSTTKTAKDFPAAIVAFRLGAGGAFIYVLLYLGRRNFQRDITTAAALWSTVQLVLGPVLAYAISFFLEAPEKQNDVVRFGAVYFLAGMSPRLIADWISDKVQKLWMSSAAEAAGTRSIALRQVQGITPTVESRLNEEGIEDVASLSMANPVRLLRNTPYDARQIVSWIDEAILITTLPKHWAALEDQGITGAIDLAWYVYDYDDEEDTGNQIPSGGGGPTGINAGGVTGNAGSGGSVVNSPAKVSTAIHRLATRIGLTDSSMLDDVVWRLADDDQVAMIWAIYEANGSDPQTNTGAP